MIILARVFPSVKAIFLPFATNFVFGVAKSHNSLSRIHFLAEERFRGILIKYEVAWLSWQPTRVTGRSWGSKNTFHGEWPFQSWGIGAREDAWRLLDFGREMDVTDMALTLRADFPHDAYWTHGTVELSDGASLSFDLRRTGDRQRIPLGEHRVRWMRLIRMKKSDDPSAFPALIEWEVFGRDASR